MDDLSRVTGLSKGSLYGAFGDKEALFQRVFEKYCASSDESAAGLLEGPEDQALDRIRDWLTVPEGSTDRRGCLLAKATTELAWDNDRHRHTVSLGIRDAIGQLPPTCRAGAACRACRSSCRRRRARRADPDDASRARGARQGGSRDGGEKPHCQRHDRHHRAHSRARVRGPCGRLRPADSGRARGRRRERIGR